LPVLDQVIHVLLVLFEAFHADNPATVAAVTDRMLEKWRAAQDQMLAFIDGHDPEERDVALRLTGEHYPEINALAFVSCHLRDAGVLTGSAEHELATRTCKLLLDVLAAARRVVASSAG
jgi:hypothetical protein